MTGDGVIVQHGRYFYQLNCNASTAGSGKGGGNGGSSAGGNDTTGKGKGGKGKGGKGGPPGGENGTEGSGKGGGKGGPSSGGNGTTGPIANTCNWEILEKELSLPVQRAVAMILPAEYTCE